MYSKRNIFYLIVISLILTNGVSFFIGYKSGPDKQVGGNEISGLKNTASSDKVLTYGLGGDPGQTTDFASFWQTWGILEQKFVPRSTSTEHITTQQERVEEKSHSRICEWLLFYIKQRTVLCER
jgi:hypothetical protein